VSDEMRDALEEVLEAQRNGWQPRGVGELLAATTSATSAGTRRRSPSSSTARSSPAH
jgi:hypothetical protein